MKIRREFKIQLIVVYLISTLFALIGTGIMLKTQWENSIESAGVTATKDIDITSSTVKYILSNGSKLLDFTNRDLHQLIIENKYDHLAIQQTISNSASIFTIDNDVQSYGLIIVTDINGNLIGRSDGQPLTDINFQDRFYFQALKNNSDKKFVIGPLLIVLQKNGYKLKK